MAFDFHGVAADDWVHSGKVPTAGSSSETAIYRNGFKRSLDIFLVLASAIIVLPLIVMLALLVSLDGGSPFYTQLRVGRNGKHFRMLKLRSMVPDAETFLARYLEQNPEACLEWEANQKLKNDPRITRLGRILRKTSMDELPQLFNVLLGQMSLVGPRPMMIKQRDLYPGLGYYSLRPGITGLWQISKRNECRFRDRAKFDDAYNQMLSLRTDILILWRTVWVVIRGSGY